MTAQDSLPAETEQWSHIDELAYRVDRLHSLFNIATQSLEELDRRDLDARSLDRICRLLSLGADLLEPLGQQIAAVGRSAENTPPNPYAIGRLADAAKELNALQLEGAARMLIGMVRDQANPAALDGIAKWLKKVIKKCGT